MSPSTTSSFKLLVSQLQTELTACIRLCEDVRTNRRLEGTINLSNLQNGFESAEMSIPNSFNTFRRIAGPAMDAGDERARYEISEYISDLKSQIKIHLAEIAQPRRDRHDRQHPGFKAMLAEWEDIYRRVNATMRNLSMRIEDSPEPEPEPKPKKKNTDDVTITMKELDFMLEHVKNSWEEVIINGQIVYVNAFDKKRTVRDRPEGAWIKELPSAKRTSRVPSWDAPSSRRTKMPSWDR